MTGLLIMLACTGEQGKETVSSTESKVPSISIHAAAFTGNVKAIEQYITAKTDLNEKDQYGSSPLIIASTFGKTEVAKALIDGGADMNVRSADGSTPLHTAAFFCRKEIVEALLAAGADTRLKNNYGATALESISTPFDEVKMIYDQISKDLGPLGLKLDYEYLRNTRPIIVEMISRNQH
ncbi:ankyrin repeat domain-containing protein [Fulvivirgaceae bacterium BMA10]|uniref:Ankyrin repeat domain-containing protein n=2 Tax=Splendidivirga corallicola TaxID=3051826 RepID=A0ABT8KZ33_9BACT|nr:ankyrin repeat domain-containing protein [Fulvivirgaceae bacterium BMA10]